MTGKIPRLFPAIMKRVVDGDTCYLTVDLGFRIYGELEFRLYGINCPEMNTPEGKAAKQFAIDWFAKEPVFIVESYKDPEKFGRWLGIIYTKDMDKANTLNAQLLTAGHAKEYYP